MSIWMVKCKQPYSNNKWHTHILPSPQCLLTVAIAFIPSVYALRSPFAIYIFDVAIAIENIYLFCAETHTGIYLSRRMTSRFNTAFVCCLSFFHLFFFFGFPSHLQFCSCSLTTTQFARLFLIIWIEALIFGSYAIQFKVAIRWKMKFSMLDGWLFFSLLVGNVMWSQYV